MRMRRVDFIHGCCRNGGRVALPKPILSAKRADIDNVTPAVKVASKPWDGDTTVVFTIRAGFGDTLYIRASYPYAATLADKRSALRWRDKFLLPWLQEVGVVSRVAGNPPTFLPL